MARFLFVVPPFAGHVNPTIPVAAELVSRGHEVAWAGLPGQLQAMLPAWGRFIPAGSEEWAAVVAERNVLRSDLRGAAAYKFLLEEALIPMCQVMVDGVEDAVTDFAPDVVVGDQQTWAGAVVARRRGIPWVTSATTSAEMVDPLAGLPKVAEAFHRTRVQLQVDHGVPVEVAEAGDLRLSEHLVLAYTSSALVGDGLESVADASPVAYVGPSGLDRAEVDDFDWEAVDPDLPLVLVSLGTLSDGASRRFWEVAADAFRDQPWQGIFVAPAELVPDPPANVVVRDRVPQLAVLRRADAVVSHGGHNTVCESLSNGLPLVLAPIRDDQPVIADQVVRAGAGVRVKFARVRADGLRTAIESALHDPQLRAGAQAMAADLAACGGASAAADALVELLTPAHVSQIRSSRKIGISRSVFFWYSP